MLRRSHRVTTSQFEEVLKRGRVIHSPLFVVRTMKEELISGSAQTGAGVRISAVAPIKIAKTSVARHRIRRRIYEATRRYVAKLPSGTVVIIFAKQPAVAAGLPELRQAVGDIFVKAGLLR